MVVNPSFPAKTVPEFIAYAKANPGKINMASAGIGSPQHVAGELFKMMAGVEWCTCRIAARPARRPICSAASVQVMFDAMPSSLGYIRGGKLRALAVTTDEPLGRRCRTCRR